MILILARVVFVALVATVGDFVWFEYGVRHTTLHGVIHGGAILLAVGTVLGQQAGAWVRGAAGGVFAGVAGALAFYAVADGLGFLGALLTAWVFTWMVLAAVAAWIRGDVARVRQWLTPGLFAAAASGVTFYLVAGIWTGNPEGGRNYLWHLVAWTLAWGPGVTILTWKGAQR